MRIWHEKLISKLCRQHLLAMWREGLGAYSIITNNKKGYRNHPVVKEFENAPLALWDRLFSVRMEMLKRGYNPKEMPKKPDYDYSQEIVEGICEWQILDEQIEILKSKNCDCKICK